MSQVHNISSSGMFTQFKLTQVLRTVDLDYNNLMIALSVLPPGASFNQFPLAIVDKSQQVNGGRIKQVNILKAVLISNELYQSSLLAAPAVVPFISEIKASDDYFFPNGTFIRTLPSVSPTQSRFTKSFLVGAGGLVTVGVPFVDATVISNLPFTVTNGAGGTITYPVGDIGSTVTVSYVTEVIHPTLFITRQETQTVVPSLVIENTVSGVVLNPTLAGLLGLTLPPY